MIKIENVEVYGFEAAIRGMRNPMNSWDRSDSGYEYYQTAKVIDGDIVCCPEYIVGENDLDLMRRLANGGPVHAKYRRMIVVYLDITAPLYWWKEFDTYKVGTVSNSCSTMHKIHEKEFTLDDFSHEHLLGYNRECMIGELGDSYYLDSPIEILEQTIAMLNKARELFIETKDKTYWWQMIQLLPSSYNQKRTIMLDYEVLVNIYRWRRHHKMDVGHWDVICDWIETLPCSEIITGNAKELITNE